MKSIVLAGMFILSVAGLCCKSQSGATKNNAGSGSHNSRNSLDWEGSYRGVLPCADCAGIQTTITLNKDLRYRLKAKYMGKPDSVREYSGNFTWNDPGNAITLEGLGNGQAASYFVGENTLTQLDKHGNRVTGAFADSYILSKEQHALLEKYWKLTEVYGKPVIVDSTYRREPHIIFKETDNRMIGHGGCNSLSGSYELKGGNRITISQIITTKMFCQNMPVETQLLQALQTADNYTVVADTLVLNKARMAPLARFRTVYMK